jgi:ABC-type Fe3+-hydroxamate transport system substrate-binding protein
MNLVKEREHTYSHRVDDQLQLARKNNWQGQLHAVRQDQVYVMEENIKISREKIARFQDTLKLIS